MSCSAEVSPPPPPEPPPPDEVRASMLDYYGGDDVAGTSTVNPGLATSASLADADYLSYEDQLDSTPTTTLPIGEYPKGASGVGASAVTGAVLVFVSLTAIGFMVLKLQGSMLRDIIAQVRERMARKPSPNKRGARAGEFESIVTASADFEEAVHESQLEHTPTRATYYGEPTRHLPPTKHRASPIPISMSMDDDDDDHLLVGEAMEPPHIAVARPEI